MPPDDPTGPSPEELKRQAEAQSKVNEVSEDQLQMTKEQTRAARELQAAIRPLPDAYKQWGRFTKENAEQQGKLTSVLGQQISALQRTHGVLGQLSGLTSGFMTKIKNAVTLQHQYSRALDEMRTGQTAFASSMHATTDATETASQQSQKYVTAVQHAYHAAYRISNKYHIEQQEIFNTSKRLQGAFADQLGAIKNQSKALEQLTETTVDFSRFVGVDLAKATEYMTSRSTDSQKTFKELRRETIQVSMAMDEYSRRLRNLGKRTQMTAQVTRKQMIQTLQELGHEFKSGLFDVGKWSGVFAKMIPQMRKHNIHSREALEGMKQFVKGVAGADFSRFEHAQAALAVLQEDFSKMEEGPMKKRLALVFKAQQEGRLAIPQALKAITTAMEGDPKWAGRVIEVMQQYSPQLMNVVMEKSVTNPLVRIFLEGQITSGQMSKTLRESSKGSKERENKFKENQQKLLKEAHTAQSLRHSAASRWFKFQNKVTNFIETYWKYFALGLAALGIGKALLGGVGGLLGGAGALGGVGAALTGPAFATALGPLIAGPVAAAGGVAIGYGMLKMGEKYLDPIGGDIRKFLGTEQKGVTKFRGVITPKIRKEFKSLGKMIDKGRSVWDQLTVVQKKNILIMEARHKQISRHMKVEEKGKKLAITESMKLQRRGVKEAVSGVLLKAAKAKEVTPELLETLGREIASVAAVQRGGGERLLAEEIEQSQLAKSLTKEQRAMLIKSAKAEAQRAKVISAMGITAGTKREERIRKRIWETSPEQIAAMMASLRKAGAKAEAAGVFQLPPELLGKAAVGPSGELKFSVEQTPGVEQTALSQDAAGKIKITFPTSQTVVVDGRTIGNMINKATKTV